MQRYTYHVGFCSGNQVEIIDLSKISDYERLAKVYGTGIRAIDMFTSMMDSESQMLNELDKKGLIKGAGSLNLFLRDHSKNKVREVYGGLLYKKSWQFLNRETIINFFKANIKKPEFIEEAIEFFDIYFGIKKTSDLNEPADTDEMANTDSESQEESKNIHPLNIYLTTLSQYKEMLTFPYQTANQRIVNKHIEKLRTDSLDALIIMADHISHKKSDQAKGLGEVNYRGLRDVAMFCYHIQKHLQSQKVKLKKSPIKEGIDTGLSELEEYNRDNDEFLTPEEYEMMHAEGEKVVNAR